MRFFHLGDLHFGKSLHKLSMTDKDQPFWIERFLEKVDEYQPEAIVVAGDIYDSGTPSVEAVKLFDRFLTELVNRDKYVFIIPGNHDSVIRLSFMDRILSRQRVFIAGELQSELTHQTISDGRTEVTFWLMPYITPRLVARVLPDADISDYNSAAGALIAAQSLNDKAVNVLVAHQNVLGGSKPTEHSGSETIIGGIGEMDYRTFDKFDYVALGHIHNRQEIGRPAVLYSGCPLYYDFSEINREKPLTLVEIDGKGKIEAKKVEIELLHGMREEKGTLDEVLEKGRNIPLEEKVRNYYQVILTDKNVPYNATEALRNCYGETLLHIGREYDRVISDEKQAARFSSGEKAKQLDEQFTDFYNDEGLEKLLGNVQKKILAKLVEQQEQQGGDYMLLDENNIRKKELLEKDTAELIEMLYGLAGEEIK